MDRIPNTNSTIRSQLFEYQIIRIIRCNSEIHTCYDIILEKHIMYSTGCPKQFDNFIMIWKHANIFLQTGQHLFKILL